MRCVEPRKCELSVCGLNRTPSGRPLVTRSGTRLQLAAAATATTHPVRDCELQAFGALQ